MSGELEKCKYEQISPGKAIQIVTIHNNRFTLNEHNLKSVVLNPDFKNKPLFIISIVGPFRTGKSFLLTNFLKYLGEIDDDLIKNQGFNWSYGSKTITKGIWMWDRPILIKNDSFEFAIILMDTQGTFDNLTTESECATIFSLSTFISSLQIYNLKSNLEKTDLEFLNLFSQYGKLSEKFLANNRNKTNRDQLFQFEQLTFLIRDWQFPDEFYYGFQGGESFLNFRLKECETNPFNNDSKELISNLKMNFKTKNCFLMPHPGYAVLKKEFKGNSNEMDLLFVNQCKKFFKSIVENISSCNQHFNNGEFLFEIFKDYIKVFDRNDIPKMDSIFKVYSKHNNILIIKSKLNSYKVILDKLIDENQPFVNNNLFEKTSQETIEKCINEFKMIYININNNTNDLVEFKNDLLNLQNYFKQLNKQNKTNYVKYLNDKILIDYEHDMMAYLKKYDYVKSVDLYLKHSQVKLKCLHRYDDRKCDLKSEFTDINLKLDSYLKDFDNENRLKRNKIISKVKSNSIMKYKRFMDEMLAKNFKLNKDEFYSCHLDAVEKCLNEFEQMTRNDYDLNTDYDSLVHELGSLYSIYLIKHEKNHQNEPKLIMNNKLVNHVFSLILDRKKSILSCSKTSLTNIKLLNSPKQLIESTFFMIGLGSIVFFSYLMLIYDYLISFNLRTNLFNYFFLIFKFFSYHSILIMIDFLNIIKSKFKYLDSSNYNNVNSKIKPD